MLISVQICVTSMISPSPTGLYPSIRCMGNPAGDNFGSAIRREMRILPWALVEKYVNIRRQS